MNMIAMQKMTPKEFRIAAKRHHEHYGFTPAQQVDTRVFQFDNAALIFIYNANTEILRGFTFDLEVLPWTTLLAKLSK